MTAQDLRAAIALGEVNLPSVTDEFRPVLEQRLAVLKAELAAEEIDAFDRPDEDDDPECLCVRVDVDRDDARDCPAHGPDSHLAKRLRAAEAADEAAFWAKEVL